MIQVTSNLKAGSAAFLKKINRVLGAENLDKMERTIAFNMAGAMRERINEQGKDSSGGDIGTYTPSYVRRRVRKYNRTADTKVILSLTRQMENDMTGGPIKTLDGWGIGFKNPHNYDKSQWTEATYDKKIFSLTEQEKADVRKIGEDFINRGIQQL